MDYIYSKILKALQGDVKMQKLSKTPLLLDRQPFFLYYSRLYLRANCKIVIIISLFLFANILLYPLFYMIYCCERVMKFC